MWVPPELKNWKPPRWFIWLLCLVARLSQRREGGWHRDGNIIVVDHLNPEQTTIRANVTLRAQLSWQLRLRLWIALRLIRLAAWIIGTGFEVGSCGKEEPEQASTDW